MNDALADLTTLRRLERIERQTRRWRLLALLSASILGATWILGQAAPEETPSAREAAAPASGEAATPKWIYEVIRFPARPPFEVKKDAARYLTDELNRGAADGWEYVGLLALESQAVGFNGLVAFRRQLEPRPGEPSAPGSP